VQVPLPAVPQHASPTLPQVPDLQPPLVHMPCVPLQAPPVATQTEPLATSQQPPLLQLLFSQHG
jgi:hypothetical protein